MDLQQKLKDLLGTESAGAWIGFMQEVERELPFLLSESGRPKKEDVQNSYIGQHGYKSWADMVKKGLKWNMHSWNAWSKAYRLIGEHPYLKELGLSASKINAMANKTQTQNGELLEGREPFPKTAELWTENTERIRTEREESKEKKSKIKDLVVKDLREKMADKEAEIEELKVYKSRIDSYESKGFFGKLFSSP